MTLFALVLALLAAVMHAVWNLLVKRSDDHLVAGWTVVAGAAVIALPILTMHGVPDRSVWDLIVISTIIQVGYVLMLASAYRVGDLSFVYPLARGTSPVLVALAGVTFLGDEISIAGWAGVALVTAALVILAWRRADRSGMGAALVTGFLISGYTSIDAAAVREQGEALSVIAAEFVLLALTLGLVVLVLRGPVAMV
ncbi:MAG TPA: EamA family transporter, partial [Acidimicrobiia bacterium]|nr:EamA family transporter [Acidimicrobiia bacterium]